MRDVVICEPLRTAVGGYGGAFRDVPVAKLAATAIRGLIDRTGVAPDLINDVILGQCYPNGEAPALGRVAALDAGLPVEVGGYQIDRRCGSGLQAVINGVLQVASGGSDFVIAGGAESMSQAEFYTTGVRWGVRGNETALHDRLARGRVTAGGLNHPVPGGMLETAENLRREYGIGRDEQDALALRSHERAVAAQRDGRFAEEIVPVTVPVRGGETIVDTDAHPRDDTSLEKLAALRAVLSRDDAESTVTAGTMRDLARPMTALYVGGMGARGKNFYNALVRRYGFEADAERIQDLYLSGQRAAAEAAVPDELIDHIHLVGPAGHVLERIEAYREAGVTMLNVIPEGPDPLASVALIRARMR